MFIFYSSLKVDFDKVFFASILIAFMGKHIPGGPYDINPEVGPFKLHF
jgi:hypothetical protein